ncbi:serine/threonine protein phosphatase [Pseudocitrobacter faecalis]|uniref:metallophosphoesterase n=1 Tax=Pseudocitrobacter faecalis TaxID=1398493 RepID=UPI0016792B95|nr:metallophosphoesterase [Pseudocitrobacter faecalis]GHD91790.1 serine/threonine protein phosphatase [Pseudocitrobacter faecalis]
MSLYQRIHGDLWRNIWVVGDLHGCYTLLMQHLNRVAFQPMQDLLISVGDLIDRGSEDVECLMMLNQPWFRAVRGNHEEMMLDALEGNGYANLWVANGGGWYFDLNVNEQHRVKALLYRIAELPLIIEVVTGDKKMVICHADYPDDHYAFNKPVDPFQVVWNRQRINRAQRGSMCLIGGADQFFFGHTPVSKPFKSANQLYIDTGAVFCGNLTLVQLQRRVKAGASSATPVADGR